MQPPCSKEQLLKSSSYVIEGVVVEKSCGEPYLGGFKGSGCQDLVEDCLFLIKVTKSIKSDYEGGDVIEYKTQLFFGIEGDQDHCASAGPRIFGYDLRIGEKIEYYFGAKHNKEFNELACPNYVIRLAIKEK